MLRLPGVLVVQRLALQQPATQMTGSTPSHGSVAQPPRAPRQPARPCHFLKVPLPNRRRGAARLSTGTVCWRDSVAFRPCHVLINALPTCAAGGHPTAGGSDRPTGLAGRPTVQRPTLPFVQPTVVVGPTRGPTPRRSDGAPHVTSQGSELVPAAGRWPL